MLGQRLECRNCGVLGHERFWAPHRQWMLAYGALSPTERVLQDLAKTMLELTIIIRATVTPALDALAELMGKLSWGADAP